MANDINVVSISGNITRDRELDYTQNGTQRAKFTVANNPNNADVANFIPVVLFGKGAEALAPYLLKGREISVVGRLSLRPYEKDGQKRTWTEVIADRVKLHGGRDRASEAPVAQEDPAAEDEIDDSDLPF